jgi:hypothetical protein
MSRKEAREPRHMTAGAWSGLAAPAVAGAAVHSTAPWYVAVPVLVVALALTIWRRRRGGGRGGGPSGRGPFGGS